MLGEFHQQQAISPVTSRENHAYSAVAGVAGYSPAYVFCRQKVRIGIVITLRRLEFQGQEHSLVFRDTYWPKPVHSEKSEKNAGAKVFRFDDLYYPNLSQI